MLLTAATCPKPPSTSIAHTWALKYSYHMMALGSVSHYSGAWSLWVGVHLMADLLAQVRAGGESICAAEPCRRLDLWPHVPDIAIVSYTSTLAQNDIDSCFGLYREQ